MSRQAYPTKLRDHSGNEVRLPPKPFASGGEGAVFEVVGRPDLVAKLYSKPQSKERCDKLSAMAKLCSPDLLKVAAWPIATLSNGNQGTVAGILMPRIANHKEIHHLYSVAQRKKDFPEADWGFLLHTARNCAIAFQSIHGHGHIVGDVNQKNIMVSKKGIVALVDCDSFQVREGNRIFRCGVGVPEYTPPELHGRKFTEIDRDTNHDLFGLAVMIFHLLMMGRHPFSGVPQANTDIPIEKAIQNGLYAYSRHSTKLKPPPHVPPLTMLDIGTRDLFDRAFGSQRRPTAAEWRAALDASMKGLQRCKNDPRHAYPMVGSCPWCQLIATNRLMFFIPTQAATDATQRIKEIQNLIQTLASMQLVFSSYLRPAPSSRFIISLPIGLRAIQKPALLSYPDPPEAAPRPVLAAMPRSPVLLPRPDLQRQPVAPAIPLAPELRPHPPFPAELDPPKLHPLPPAPPYPPVPSPDPPDFFLEWLCIVVVTAGAPMYFIAPPVGIVMMFGFGVWLLLLKLTAGMRQTKFQEFLIEEHQAECAEINAEYEALVQPVEIANKKMLQSWESANAARAAEHDRQCKTIDDENRRRSAPWEVAKAAIEAEHERAVQQIDQANHRVLADWKTENAARQARYEAACRKIELENQLLISAWDALRASRQAEHRQKCNEIDAKNRRTIETWQAANAPWTSEQKRWHDRASIAETEIKRMEDELHAQRRISISKFQRRKADAVDALKHHDGVRQDYERDLRQAEINSKKIQLEEHLDKSLIRLAKLKGITSDRILSLESFGIETAKDVDILDHQKVPGIGPVLSGRLFEWRDKLASSFRPKHGLPESERTRIATRYAPILLPLYQALQAAINDLQLITVSHGDAEKGRIKGIAVAVQDLATAEAHMHVMKVE